MSKETKVQEIEIEAKNDYEHIRLRTNMYLGSNSPQTQTILSYDENNSPILAEMTWVPAIYTCFREILDNALDEVVGFGQGNKIDITYDEKEKIFSVRDNGRGIPFTWDEKHQKHKATLALTQPRAGRNFGERGELAGTNGIGSSAVSITSAWFDIDIGRDGERFQQRCTEANPMFDNGDELIISKPEITKYTGASYTFIKFKPSTEVFKNQDLPLKFVQDRVFEIAMSNPTVKMTFNGEPVKVKITPAQTIFAGKRPVTFDVRDEDFRSTFWIIPEWNTGAEYNHSLVNNILAFQGGAHIDAFRRNFYSGLLKALEKESKKRKLTPNNSDVTDGVLIYNITRMKAPDFDSQSKTRLINESAGASIRDHFKNEDFFTDIIKKNKEWIDQIYERCAERTMKKDESEEKKQAKQAKKKKDPTLLDAAGRDRSKCILLLAEGLSAISGVSNVRDPDVHGGLPLRGKVLNVHGLSKLEVLQNEVLVKIMNAIGLDLNTTADRMKLRYGKVYIATDSDQDGANITALLINFFYTFWPELFKDGNPYFYSFETPFIIAKKGKEKKYWYSYNVDDFDPHTMKGWDITRAKGLATLKDADWSYSLENPVVFPYTEDENLKEALDLIFNKKRADDRKDWIDS